MSVILASRISKSFGDRVVISGLTAEVRSHTLTAVVGPSGSGKSTLLAMLGGFLMPDSGTVRLASGTPVRPAVAWIPQGSNVISSRTIVDNVALGALARGESLSRARAEAMEILSTMGLFDLAFTKARVASGGERQRASVARGLCSRRPFIFADEPTASLDLRASDQVVVCLRAAAVRGVGVVVATHDSRVAAAADSVVDLRDFAS